MTDRGMIIALAVLVAWTDAARWVRSDPRMGIAGTLMATAFSMTLWALWAWCAS